MNNAVTNIHMQVFVWICFQFSWLCAWVCDGRVIW